MVLDVWVWKQGTERLRLQTETRFESRIESVLDAAISRVQAHELVLRGGAGLHATHDSLDRKIWKSYIQTLQLDQESNGIQGMGFAVDIPPGKKPALEKSIRSQGYPEFHIWPAQPNRSMAPIVFLEPSAGVDNIALGYDMYSEPVRREAMERARDSGLPALSGKVILEKEYPWETKPLIGFLLYHPVYLSGAPTYTVEERREALEGYVYSPFPIKYIMRGIRPNLETPEMGFKIFDGKSSNPDHLLYQSANFPVDAGSDIRTLSWTETVELYGHSWTFQFDAGPAFGIEEEFTRPDMLLIFGAIASLLLVGGILILLTTRVRAQRLAETMTSELRILKANLEKLVAQRTLELEKANRELGSEMARREAREEQLRQAQKMEAVGRLAGGVAHDFNNLLTAINGYTALCLDIAGEDSPLRSNLEEIRRAGEMAASLTRQLLAYSRKQILSFRMVSLNEAVGDMGRMIQRLIGGEIVVDLRLSPDTGRVRVDPAQLQQALINLALNARDAMPDGGRLTIETGVLELTEADTGGLVGEAAKSGDGAIPPGRYAVLTVRDSGQGMDEPVKARLFEPYFTTKQLGHDKGTGLGLSMVYGIVKQSGGFIQVYSAPGMGTEFRIILPECRESGVVESRKT